MISEILLNLLLAFSSFLGVTDYPTTKSNWSVESQWHKNSQNLNKTILSAKVENIGCKEGMLYEFPNIMHASQFIFLDGKLISSFGSTDMSWSQSFYGAPIVNCDILAQGEEISWVVINPLRYFSRIVYWPRAREKLSVIHPDEVINIAAFGALLILCIYLVVVTKGTEVRKLGYSIALFSGSMAVFFLLSVSGYFNIPLSLFWTHKLAIFSISIAAVGMTRYVNVDKLIPKLIYRVLMTIFSLISIGILLSTVSDNVQVFATVLFFPIGLLLWSSCLALFKSIKEKRDLADILNVAALLAFALASTYDIFYTFGIHNNGVFLAYGIVGSVFLFSNAIHLRVSETYKERDYLRLNLEKEIKTKTNDLEKAMLDLKSTQAELVQSAKLASLGTLSAGIAHEINNSINYVNGALIPLERILMKDEAIKSNTKVVKLLDVMKDGLNLTMDIIKSLRNFTGLNKAKFNDISVLEVLKSILTISKTKLRDNIKVNLEIDSSMHVYGSEVGLSQVFMNLVTNSIDAMPEGGEITVSAKQIDNDVYVEFKDTGSGMPQEVIDRLFDPFFTTKEVGKGTGLGMHIVKKEIEKHHGDIKIESNLGEGTKFFIKLPVNAVQSTEGAA